MSLSEKQPPQEVEDAIVGLAAVERSRHEDAWQEFRARKTFGSLDGLRAFCIFAVIWHHIPRGRSDVRILGQGFLGVDMFFVLSGFLIVTLLLREQDRNGAISLSKFYARRTLRIFPIYYLVIFGTLFSYLILKPNSPTARSFYQSFPYLVTYTSNWFEDHQSNMSIMWSLATEEQFYLVWPAIQKFLPRWWVLAILMAVIAINQVVNYGLLDPQIRALYGGPSARIPSIWQTTFTPIALGVLLAHLLHDRKSFGRMYPILGQRWSCIAAVAFLGVLLVFAPADISGSPRLAIQLAMMFLLGSLVVREDHLARGILAIEPFRFAGMVSYGMYLYHMFVIHFVRSGLNRIHGAPVSPALFFLLSAAGTMAVAGLSFYLIERPILRLKSRFSV